MASYTWIKLYIEILDDPKVGMLPDAMKWRMVQLFLVARERNKDGLLGSISQVAWRLRVSEDDLIISMKTLADNGIVKDTPDGWMVINFVKRQAPVAGKDRVGAFRERNKDVTKSYNNSNESVTTENIDSISISNSLYDSDSLIKESTENQKSKSPTDAEFFAHFGNFNNQREQKRWVAMVESVGFEQAQRIAEWAEKKEINMTNRMGLMDSMETAAKNWKQGQSKPGKKDGNEDFFTKLNKLRVPEVIDGNA